MECRTKPFRCKHLVLYPQISNKLLKIFHSSYDALIYASTLSGRKPGTFAYHLSETADHNFTGLQDEVVSIVLGWLEAFQRDALVDGLWLAGVKPGKGRL